jgi:hypothetical protein
MAKPILPTPILKGKDARRFVESMRAVVNRKPNKTEKKLIELIRCV